MVGLGARDRLVHEVGDRGIDRPVDDDAGQRLFGNRLRREHDSGEQREGEREDAARHADAPPMPSAPMTLRMSSHTSRLSPGLRRR